MKFKFIYQICIFLTCTNALVLAQDNSFSEKKEEAESISSAQDIMSLRDPFRKPKISRQKIVLTSELETIPVQEFKLNGVITGPGKMKAMLIGPKGKTYFVSKGDKIGLRDGEITEITSSKIFVTEKIINVLGQEESLAVEILLSKKGEENATEFQQQQE